MNTNTPTRQLTVEACRFILLAEKLNIYLTDDPGMAARALAEMHRVPALEITPLHQN